MSLTIHNEPKAEDRKWNETTGTWEYPDKTKWRDVVLSLTEESQNALSITNEGNPHTGLTIDDAEGTIDEANGTIDAPHISLVNESKN